MRRIKLAKNIGFCSGVKRAVNIVEKTLSKSKNKVYSLGPIIHNPQVIQQLKKRNLRIASSLNQIEDSCLVILSSHGSPRHILNIAKKKHLRLVDVTCPYVSSVQKICSTLSKEGLKVIIIGDRRHPEVRALKDLASGAHIIEKLKGIKKNEFSYQRIGIISQTTQASGIFFKAVSKILKSNPRVKEVHIFNTVCLDTIKRQEEVKKLAAQVDALLIIGSSTSANTKRLFSISRKINKRAYLVETETTPLNKKLINAKTVGLISGASTPDWLVKKIIQKIRKGGNTK
jgi:4-hydroxy-3-methylbut-2-enyl diphosphate reductase